MDAKRFDEVTRSMGEPAGRRGMVKAAAGGALALLGIGALGRAASAGTTDGYEGDICEVNDNCRRGLRCKGVGRCRYKAGCGGKRGDACRNSGDCCSGLRCKNNNCKKKN